MVDGVQVLVAVCLVLATVICCWRFYLRLIVSRHDIWIELALLTGLTGLAVMSGIQIKMMKLIGTAKGPQDVVVIQKYFFAGSFFYLGTLWSVKISINLLHLRLTNKFPALYMWTRWSLWFMFLSLPVMYVFFLLACLPIHRHWDAPLGIVKQCPPIMRSWDFWVHFTVNVVTDLWLCTLPFTALLRIQEKRLRVAVCGVYGLALVTIIVSIVRTVLLGIDPNANVKYIISLTIIELATTVIIGSLPGISSAFTRKYVYGSRNKSNPDWTKNAGALHQTQQWNSLDNDSHDYSADNVELRAARGLPDGRGSTKDYATEDEAGSVDRVERAGPVAVTMI